jgi:hypothetical protein
MVVGKIRENALTESNVLDLVRLVDEEMDGIASSSGSGWRPPNRSLPT